MPLTCCDVRVSVHWDPSGMAPLVSYRSLSHLVLYPFDLFRFAGYPTSKKESITLKTSEAHESTDAEAKSYISSM